MNVTSRSTQDTLFFAHCDRSRNDTTCNFMTTFKDKCIMIIVPCVHTCSLYFSAADSVPNFQEMKNPKNVDQRSSLLHYRICLKQSRNGTKFFTNLQDQKLAKTATFTRWNLLSLAVHLQRARMRMFEKGVYDNTETKRANTGTTDKHIWHP